MKKFLNPTKEAQKEAMKNPNGYVYVIESNFKHKKNIPSSAIIGAWEVDENGEIIGSFLPNPNHSSRVS